MNPRQQHAAALMMQAAAMQQQHQQLFNPMSQMELVPSGNLPPGFDPSACRSVYVGNIHPLVTESLLAEVFQSIGPLEGCKLIRKEKTSFGFVDYQDRKAAALAIMSLHGRQLFSQPIKVNWAYASGQREDTSGHYHIFVGDLSSEVTDATLYACFSGFSSLSDARVMWDNKTGRSRGFGFVSFRNQQDAQSAINDLTGKWVGSRQIRCNWATKSSVEDKLKDDSIQNTSTLSNGCSGNIDGGQGNPCDDSPEKNAAYTTVYVGNLAPEMTQAELHRHFHNLGVGVIEEVRIQKEKGFGFVRFQTHDQAALAIQMANGKLLCGKSIKCLWGSKPTPPGMASNPLPPPAPPLQYLGYTQAELLAYQRQLVLSQAAAAAAAAAGGGSVADQHGLAAQGSIGSHAMYTSYPTNSNTQQLMYYN